MDNGRILEAGFHRTLFMPLDRSALIAQHICPENAQDLRAMVSNLFTVDAARFRNAVGDQLQQLTASELAALPYICCPRSGMNMGGVISQHASNGWGGRYNSAFRALAKTGFDVNVQQANGVYPALHAVWVDRVNLDEDDLRWAFRHGLDPLRHYPDMSGGQSLLSIEFDGKSDEFYAFIGGAVRRRLRLLDRDEQVQTFEMLQRTAVAEHGTWLAELARQLLNQEVAPTAVARGRGARNKL